MSARYIYTQSANPSDTSKIWLALRESEFVPPLILAGFLLILSVLLGKKKGVLANAHFGGRLEKLNAVRKAQKQRQKQNLAKTALYAGDKPMEGWKPQIQTLITGNPPVLPLPNLNQHLIALGSTGCGKTTTIVNRIIQDAIRRGHPMIVFDPKGELAMINAPYAKAYDYKDYYLAPGQPHTDCFNLLDWMRSSSDSIRSQQITKTIQSNSNPQGINKTDPFFSGSGEILVRSVLMLTKESEYPDLLTAKRILGLSDLCDRIQEAQKRGSLNPWIENSFQQFLSGKNAAKTIAGIASTAGLVFDSFCQEEFMNAFIGKSTIPMDFTGKKILFVQPPIDREDVVMPVLTTAVEILVEENMSVKRTEPLLLILEEFPLGHWRKAEQWMSFRRSNGLAVILIAQLFAQIRRRYGQDTALSILGNANTQIYFNCNDVETAKMVSDRCGYKEVRFKSDSTSTGKSGRTRSSSEQRQKVPLMTHDELLSMSEGEFVMFNLAYGAGGKSSIPIHQTYRIPEFELDRDEQLKSEGWDLIYPELCERVKPFHLDQKQRVAALLKRGEAAEKLLPLSSSPTTTPTTTTNATLQGILAKHKQDYLDYV